MGRKLFFAQRDKVAKEKRRKHLEQSGYVFGAHANEDAIRDKDKRITKTKNVYKQHAELWKDFLEQNGIRDYDNYPGSKAPDHQLIKEFLRWYIHSTRGRLSKNGRPVVKSVVSCAERFFGGLEEEMQISVGLVDRKEIFNWIKRSLTAEGTIENINSPNKSFTRKDFIRTVSSLWQTDHHRFIPGLLKVIILLALQLYLFTGARIGAFIPAHEDKTQRGLRYKHIDLVLFPSSTVPWKVEWRVNQVWLKNNRDPNYTIFGIGIRDTRRPQFAAGYILLALALEHGALFGINTVEDLAQYDLSNGPIPLRWKDEYLEKPVLRNVIAEGPQDIPLTKDAFGECLRQIFTAAGYSERPKVHEIRKYLGKKIEEKKHGSALVSQIYGHKGPGTYPKDYLLHCSSIDTVSAVLDEKEQSDHIEYFQGFDRFYEPGLPGELPAQIEESILEKPELVEIRSRIEHLESQNHDKELIKAERIRYRKTLVRHRLVELKEYQTRWVQERRDQKILNRGKEEPMVVDNDVSTRAQALVMPEISRIATLMSCTKELSFDEMLLFVQDLKTQCSRDFGVVYLPSESPIHGFCPVRSCQEEIASLKKSERSAHIHECVRHEMALDLQVSESEMRFCYECMKWFLSFQWRDHCTSHLQSWRTQHCEVIIYRHTVIRPGYCPFCLPKTDLLPEDRLQYWLRTDNLKRHIEEEHLPEIQWPTTKPICGCTQTFENDHGLRHHLHDIHGLNKAIWLNPKPPRKRKRVCKAELQTEPGERPKKPRFYRYPPPRHEHEHQLSDKIFLPVPTLHSFVAEYPDQYYCSSLRGSSSEGSKSSSVVSCLSAASSPLSSRPTTPGLEVIDPRILEPSEIDKEQGRQPYDQISMQPNPLKISLDKQEIKTKPFGDATGSQSPVQSLSVQPNIGLEINDPRTLDPSDIHAEGARRPCDHVASQLNSLIVCPSEVETKPVSLSGTTQAEYSPTCFVTSEANEQQKVLREDCPTSTSASDETVPAEHEYEYPIHNQIEVGDENLPHFDEAPVTRSRGRLTRAKARSRPHHPDHKLRQRLNTKETQKLRQLKSQNLTLRQIGIHFADVDMAFLRHVWMDIKPSQRCTRSRASRMGG